MAGEGEEQLMIEPKVLEFWVSTKRIKNRCSLPDIQDISQARHLLRIMTEGEVFFPRRYRHSMRIQALRRGAGITLVSTERRC